MNAEAIDELKELAKGCKAAALFPPKGGDAWYRIGLKIEKLTAQLERDAALEGGTGE